MNIISISQVTFLNHILCFKQVRNEIDNFKVSLPKLSGESRVLSDYSDNYKILLEAINSYGQLLGRDISLIEKSGEAMLEQDKAIGNIFNK